MNTLAASIDAFVAPLSGALSAFVFFVSVFDQQVPLVVAWLAIGALFTLCLRFINIRGFGWQFVTYEVTLRIHQPRGKSVTSER